MLETSANHSTISLKPLPICVQISPLGAGWAKLAEVRRHIELFRASGKFSYAYMTLGGEKEYYLASACERVVIPPSANLSLRGLAVSGKPYPSRPYLFWDLGWTKFWDAPSSASCLPKST